MSRSTADAAEELVQRVVDCNGEEESGRAISRRRILQTLDGSGLSESAVDRALATLKRRDAVTQCSDGYIPAV